jgi:hypothetical protein
MGEEDLCHVMKSLLAEFDISVETAGSRNVEEMLENRLERYP